MSTTKVEPGLINSVVGVTGAGAVLQCLTATDDTVRTTTGTSYAVNSNTLQVDITPSATSSKVLIMVTSASYSDSGAGIGYLASN